MAPPRLLDKKDIAAAVAAARSRLRDVQVRYTVKYTFPEPPEPPPATGDGEGFFQAPRPAFDQRKVFLAWRGDAMLIMNDSIGSPALGGGRYTYWYSFDGTRSMYYQATNATAEMLLGRFEDTAERSSIGDPYCGLLFHHPDASAVRPDGSSIPIDLLKNIVSFDGSKLRSQTELVDGHPCYVVDVMTSWNTRAITLWLDPRRGFLPVRSHWFDQSKEANCYRETTITEATECMDGVWLPVRGSSVYSSGDKKEVIVDTEGGGGPDIKINSGIGLRYFDLLRRLPPGISVWDRDKDLTWVAAGVDMEALAERAWRRR